MTIVSFAIARSVPTSVVFILLKLEIYFVVSPKRLTCKYGNISQIAFLEIYLVKVTNFAKV